MKFYNIIKIHKAIIKIIKTQDGIVLFDNSFLLSKRFCIWFNDTTLHFFAEIGDTSIDILVNVWIRFYDNSNEDDVLALEEYLNKTVQLFDKKCCCYISCGKKLIENRTWSNGKSDLIYTFKISETPIRHDIIDIIKKILIKAKDKFDFFFSDNKNCIFEKVQNKKYKTIPTYLEQCKENPNNPFI